MKKIIVNSLEKKYGPTVALKAFSAVFEPGQFIGVIGPNGAGKTTLLSTLANIQKPSGGKIDFVNLNFKNIGWSSQRMSLDWLLTTEENILLGAKLFSKTSAQAKQTCFQLLKDFDLWEYRKCFPENLSGGQQQRIQVARTLAQDPDIIFLDEPTSALDLEFSQNVMLSLQHLAKKGKIVFISSHDLRLLEGYCTHALLIKEGEVIYFGSVNKVNETLGEHESLISKESSLEEVFWKMLTKFKS